MRSIFLPIVLGLTPAPPRFYLKSNSWSTSEEQTFEIHKVSDGQARCLDGSSPVYYFRPGHGTGQNKFIFYMEGGGWCHYLKGDNIIRSKKYFFRHEMAIFIFSRRRIKDA